MSNVVLVTSAVYTNYGIYDTKQRIQQTLDTVKSAKQYIPDCTVILIDNSTTAIAQDDSDELNELIDLVDYYIDNSDDKDIQHFHNNITNYDIGKNSMECIGMYKALAYMSTNAEIMDIITSASRIFKLSGRYQVTDKFDITKPTTPAENASPDAMRRPPARLDWSISRRRIKGRTGSTQGMMLMDRPATIASR